MKNPLSITDADTLLALLNSRQKTNAIPSEEELRTTLMARVRGQDEIVEDLIRLVRRQKAKIHRDRPVGNILFLGPTGTGKTELAKALTEALYGDEDAMKRFDCSELMGAQGKTRLIGSATGFVGSEKGGQLTRAMLNNPDRIVLFDEIEKADPEVFDLFLSMMGDGRLTEQGTDKEADFTQSIIILTSNAEADAIGKIHDQLEDPYKRTDAIKKHLRDTKVFRPEILGRFDRIYVFQPLPQEVMAEITAIKASQLAHQYDLKLNFIDPHVLYDAMVDSMKLSEFGTRELVRILDDMLADGMFAARKADATEIEIQRDESGTLTVIPVDGAIESTVA